MKWMKQVGHGSSHNGYEFYGRFNKITMNFGKSFEYKTKLIEKEASWTQQLGAWEISSLGQDPPNAWNMYTKIITCQASLIYLRHYSNFNKSQCLFSFFWEQMEESIAKRRKTNQKSRREHPLQSPESKKLMSLLQKSLLLRLLRTTPWSISQEKNTTLVQMKNSPPIL